MFIGLTVLYIGAERIGEIKHIRHEEGITTFEMWDTDQVYRTDKLTMLDIMIGSGDRITIPEEERQ